MSPSPRQRRRWEKEAEEKARYAAGTKGGDWEDWFAQFMPIGQPFSDLPLTKNGYEKVKEYNYTAPDGKLLYQVLRYHHRHVKGAKTFIQRRQDPDSGEWLNGAGPLKVLYRWQGIAARLDEDVHVCEGEKDADRLAELGLLATTVAGQNWSDVAAQALQGRNVIILEDNDDEGRENAVESAEQLRGIAKSIKIVRLPGLDPKADVSDWLDAGHTNEELIAIGQSVPAWGSICAKTYDFPDESTLEPWDFLYGKHLLRGTVSGTAAFGGTGKSSLAIVEALALTSTKNLLNQQVSPDPLRVLLINLEDNRKAMDKKIAAAMRHHGLKPSDIGDRLFVLAKGEIKIKIATQLSGRMIERNEELIRQLIDFIVANKIDVVSIDPFVKTHGVNENDNAAIQAVVECYDDIAEATNCAIHLWHHTRKTGGNAVSIESVRGAVAFVDACRSARVLETMTKAEAKDLHLENRSRFFFREFNGKRNFAQPTDESNWYELHNVTLANFQDEVGVVCSWMHPGAADPDALLSPSNIWEIKQKVAAASWREDSRAGMWVGKAVAQVLGLDVEEKKKVLVKIVKKLVADGVLEVVPGRDEHRNEKMFVRVKQTSAAV